MKTIKVNLYSFSELSEDAKKVAIEQWIKSEQEYNPLENGFIECCEELAESKGFNSCKFQYSLSCCQGDGLSFSFETFNSRNMVQIINNILGEGKQRTAKIIADSLYFEKMGGNTGRYCYAAKNDIELSIDSQKYYANIEKFIAKIENELHEIYLSVCKELETMGYNQIEYYYSEENAKESLISNEYDFTIDGKIY